MIAMRCLVKPTEKGPFKDCLGEIRAIYKDQLFLWFTQKASINGHLLRDTNGFYAFKTYEVINSGHEQLDSITDASDPFIAGKLDRRIKDKFAIGKAVYVATGTLKGYRGKVVWADEQQAVVEIFAKKNQRVTFSRDEICPVIDESAPMRMLANAPV